MVSRNCPNGTQQEPKLLSLDSTPWDLRPIHTIIDSTQTPSKPPLAAIVPPPTAETRRSSSLGHDLPDEPQRGVVKEPYDETLDFENVPQSTGRCAGSNGQFAPYGDGASLSPPNEDLFRRENETRLIRRVDTPDVDGTCSVDSHPFSFGEFDFGTLRKERASQNHLSVVKNSEITTLSDRKAREWPSVTREEPHYSLADTSSDPGATVKGSCQWTQYSTVPGTHRSSRADVLEASRNCQEAPTDDFVPPSGNSTLSDDHGSVLLRTMTTDSIATTVPGNVSGMFEQSPATRNRRLAFRDDTPYRTCRGILGTLRLRPPSSAARRTTNGRRADVQSDPEHETQYSVPSAMFGFPLPAVGRQHVDFLRDTSQLRGRKREDRVLSSNSKEACPRCPNPGPFPQVSSPGAGRSAGAEQRTVHESPGLSKLHSSLKSVARAVRSDSKGNQSGLGSKVSPTQGRKNLLALGELDWGPFGDIPVANSHDPEQAIASVKRSYRERSETGPSDTLSVASEQGATSPLPLAIAEKPIRPPVARICLQRSPCGGEYVGTSKASTMEDGNGCLRTSRISEDTPIIPPVARPTPRSQGGFPPSRGPSCSPYRNRWKEPMKESLPYVFRRSYSLPVPAPTESGKVDFLKPTSHSSNKSGTERYPDSLTAPSSTCQAEMMCVSNTPAGCAHSLELRSRPSSQELSLEAEEKGQRGIAERPVHPRKRRKVFGVPGTQLSDFSMPATPVLTRVPDSQGWSGPVKCEPYPYLSLTASSATPVPAERMALQASPSLQREKRTDAGPQVTSEKLLHEVACVDVVQNPCSIDAGRAKKRIHRVPGAPIGGELRQQTPALEEISAGPGVPAPSRQGSGEGRNTETVTKEPNSDYEIVQLEASLTYAAQPGVLKPGHLKSPIENLGCQSQSVELDEVTPRDANTAEQLSQNGENNVLSNQRGSSHHPAAVQDNILNPYHSSELSQRESYKFVSDNVAQNVQLQGSLQEKDHLPSTSAECVGESARVSLRVGPEAPSRSSSRRSYHRVTEELEHGSSPPREEAAIDSPFHVASHRILITPGANSESINVGDPMEGETQSSDGSQGPLENGPRTNDFSDVISGGTCHSLSLTPSCRRKPRNDADIVPARGPNQKPRKQPGAINGLGRDEQDDGVVTGSFCDIEGDEAVLFHMTDPSSSGSLSSEQRRNLSRASLREQRVGDSSVRHLSPGDKVWARMPGSTYYRVGVLSSTAGQVHFFDGRIHLCKHLKTFNVKTGQRVWVRSTRGGHSVARITKVWRRDEIVEIDSVVKRSFAEIALKAESGTASTAGKRYQARKVRTQRDRGQADEHQVWLSRAESERPPNPEETAGGRRPLTLVAGDDDQQLDISQPAESLDIDQFDARFGESSLRKEEKSAYSPASPESMFTGAVCNPDHGKGNTQGMLSRQGRNLRFPDANQRQENPYAENALEGPPGLERCGSARPPGFSVAARQRLPRPVGRRLVNRAELRPRLSQKKRKKAIFLMPDAGPALSDASASSRSCINSSGDENRTGRLSNTVNVPDSGSGCNGHGQSGEADILHTRTQLGDSSANRHNVPPRSPRPTRSRMSSQGGRQREGVDRSIRGEDSPGVETHPQIFNSLRFVFTGFSTRNRGALVMLVSECGGVLFDQDVPSLSKVPEPEGIVCVCGRGTIRTGKYLVSLAKGIDRVKETWIRRCIVEERLVDKDPYRVDVVRGGKLLFAGEKLVLSLQKASERAVFTSLAECLGADVVDDIPHKSRGPGRNYKSPPVLLDSDSKDWIIQCVLEQRRIPRKSCV